MATTNRSARAEYWQRMVDRFQSSGLSVRAFCKKHALSEQSLYHWRQRLRQVSHSPSVATDEQATFLPVRLVPTASSSGASQQQSLQIVTPSGFAVRCSASVPAAQLADLLRAIESTQRGEGTC